MKLFEIYYDVQKQEESEWLCNRLHQIPASSRDVAVVKFGQVFYNYHDFVISSVKEVH